MNIRRALLVCALAAGGSVAGVAPVTAADTAPSCAAGHFEHRPHYRLTDRAYWERHATALGFTARQQRRLEQVGQWCFLPVEQHRVAAAPHPVAVAVPRTTAAAPQYCLQFVGVGINVTLYGAVALKMRVEQLWCFDYKHVTSFARPPRVSHHEAAWAQALGWSWQGWSTDPDERVGPAYYRFGGIVHGGVRTWRMGHWHWSLAGIKYLGSRDIYPWVHEYGHYDATWHDSVGG